MCDHYFLTYITVAFQFSANDYLLIQFSQRKRKIFLEKNFDNGLLGIVKCPVVLSTENIID